jgi:hypothetical protein
MDIQIKINNAFDTAALTSDGVSIIFSYKSIVITEKDDYPFLALKKLRKKLEEKNIYLLINGSRKDVYPSGIGMMTAGAYVLKMGKPASSSDLVGIYEKTDRIDLISDVSNQEQFYRQWLKSLDVSNKL